VDLHKDLDAIYENGINLYGDYLKISKKKNIRLDINTQNKIKVIKEKLESYEIQCDKIEAHLAKIEGRNPRKLVIFPVLLNVVKGFGVKL
jgi:hypothetical protein